MSTQKKSWLLTLGVILMAANMRPPITTVGPVIGWIQDDLGINNLFSGLLTTLPLLAFALVSPYAARLSGRFGNRHSLYASLLMIALGMLVRMLPGWLPLYGGTLLLGAGIGVINVLLPSLIKSEYPHRLGWMTSLYTTTMVVMAGLASGSSAPLVMHLGWDWSEAIAVWLVLPLIGLLLWLPLLRKEAHEVNQTQTLHTSAPWKSPKAWAVSLFMGFQSFLFYGLVAWLPMILVHKGMAVETSGYMLLVMQLVGLPATFFTPLIVGRLKRPNRIVFALFLTGMLGFSGLYVLQGMFGLILGVCGISLLTGGSISLAYMLIAKQASNARQVAHLSGMAQTIGYLLAAVAPALLGGLYDLRGDWDLALWVFQGVNVGLLWMGLRAMNPKIRR